MAKRRDTRIKCCLPCDLLVNGDSFSGTVTDLSALGLSVRTSTWLDEGDAVRVKIRPAGKGPIDVEALVWHARRLRRRDNGETATVLGLVISNAPDEYLRLVQPPQARRPPTAVPPDVTRPPHPRSPQGSHLFQVRLKQDVGPRSCAVVVPGESAEDAKTNALAARGEGWSVLEVTRL